MSTVTSVSWLHSEDIGPIRRLTIDRPERKNAIPFDGWPELRAAFIDFEKSEARVLLITGAGGDFCAGADLDQTSMAEFTGAPARHRRMKLIGETALALHRSTKPTVAAVDGVAVGAGMNLALGCDVVVCSERARFSEIFVRRGLTLDFGGSWLLPRVVGLQRAKELALTGRFVGADEAVSLGLAVEAVPHEELGDRSMEMAESFLRGAPIAQMLAKQALNASFESSFADALSWEGQSQTIAFSTEDVAEGIAAFLQKRDPDWQGR